MFVTPDYLQHERKLLKLVQFQFPIFQDVEWRQNKDKSAIYNFDGYQEGEQTAYLDVKVRTESSTAFPTYFISKEKAEAALANPKLPFYMVYGFRGDWQVKIFDVGRCELKKTTISFTHKRSGEHLTQEVYLLPADQAFATLTVK